MKISEGRDLRTALELLHFTYAENSYPLVHLCFDRIRYNRYPYGSDLSFGGRNELEPEQDIRKTSDDDRFRHTAFVRVKRCRKVFGRKILIIFLIKKVTKRHALYSVSFF